MDIATWFALVGVFLTGRLLPGASMMLVMTASLCKGFGTAMIVATGVSTANLFWIFLVASGTVALANQFPTAFFWSIAIGTSICLLDCLEPGVQNDLFEFSSSRWFGAMACAIW